MTPDQALEARQELGRTLGRTITQREMSALMSVGGDGWRHFETGERTMRPQVAAHVRLLLSVHARRVELEAIAADVQILIDATGWKTGPHVKLPARLCTVANNLAERETT